MIIFKYFCEIVFLYFFSAIIHYNYHVFYVLKISNWINRVMKYVSKVKYVITCLLMFSCQQNMAFSALEATSSQPIRAQAPAFSETFEPGDPIAFSFTISRPSIPGYNKVVTDFVQVGDKITVSYMYGDRDGDSMQVPFYGIDNRKDAQGKDADTYLFLIDTAGNKTKITQPELLQEFLSDDMEDPSFLGILKIATYSYIIPPSAVGGHYGINTAPISKYGFPNVGKIYATDDLFSSPAIRSVNTLTEEPWPIRPNEKFKVGIWNTSRVTGTGEQQKPPVSVKPYSHKDNTEFLLLGESYTALVWYDENNNDIYDADEMVFHKLHSAPLTYKWSLYDGNDPAGGSVSTTAEIELVTSTDNTIVLPLTNQEALDKWQDAIAKGLPTTEAGIQGFTLVVDVE